jgi:hypothetical protein
MRYSPNCSFSIPAFSVGIDSVEVLVGREIFNEFEKFFGPGNRV